MSLKLHQCSRRRRPRLSGVLEHVGPQFWYRTKPHRAFAQFSLDRAVGVERVGHAVEDTRLEDDRAASAAPRSLLQQRQQREVRKVALAAQEAGSAADAVPRTAASAPLDGSNRPGRASGRNRVTRPSGGPIVRRLGFRLPAQVYPGLGLARRFLHCGLFRRRQHLGVNALMRVRRRCGCRFRRFECARLLFFWSAEGGGAWTGAGVAPSFGANRPMSKRSPAIRGRGCRSSASAKRRIRETTAANPTTITPPTSAVVPDTINVDPMAAV